LLPDPASLGERTEGKTNIGVFIEGVKDGERKKLYIYQVSDHKKCYHTTGLKSKLSVIQLEFQL